MQIKITDEERRILQDDTESGELSRRWSSQFDVQDHVVYITPMLNMHSPKLRIVPKKTIERLTYLSVLHPLPPFEKLHGNVFTQSLVTWPPSYAAETTVSPLRLLGK